MTRRKIKTAKVLVHEELSNPGQNLSPKCRVFVRLRRRCLEAWLRLRRNLSQMLMQLLLMLHLSLLMLLLQGTHMRLFCLYLIQLNTYHPLLFGHLSLKISHQGPRLTG